MRFVNCTIYKEANMGRKKGSKNRKKYNKWSYYTRKKHCIAMKKMWKMRKAKISILKRILNWITGG